MPIRRYLIDPAAFDPEAISIMSEALETACRTLKIDGEISDRQIVAERIIALAQAGTTLDAQALSDRVVAETKALRSL
jgi:hypothetical protein